MAIKTDGTLWGWSSFVPNGIPLSGISQKTPMQLGTENNWKEISCGSDHNLALKNDNSLWSCGKNFNGQLGNGLSGTLLEQNQFIKIGTESNWKSISAGSRFSLAIKNNGTIWGWGKNNFYQLGIGTNNQITTPIQIGNQTDWLKISTGDDVGFGIKTNNSLWGWGRNGNGQLGLGNATQQTNPTQIGLP
jgi:alpha-tubulin suppressor-like RCC1 family protein